MLVPSVWVFLCCVIFVYNRYFSSGSGAINVPTDAGGSSCTLAAAILPHMTVNMHINEGNNRSENQKRGTVHDEEHEIRNNEHFEETGTGVRQGGEPGGRMSGAMARIGYRWYNDGDR
jgi:hypothetical protein